MKQHTFEYSLIKAAPHTSLVDTTFTDRVMANLSRLSLPSHHFSKLRSKGSRRQRLSLKLRHVPKFALVIAALLALITLSGATYAVVQTIAAHNNVSIEKSGVNQFGREQLNVNFDSCAEEKKLGTTYELKRNSGLTAEDGAKVLQARCEIDVINSWVENDKTTTSYEQTSSAPAHIGIDLATATTIKTMDATSITTVEGRQKPFPADARVVANNQVADRTTLNTGDTILYFSPSLINPTYSSSLDVIVFKLTLPAKYYNNDLQSYVRTRSACRGNPTLQCLQESPINAVTLIVSHGGAWAADRYQTDPPKSLQGKVVSYDATSIQLDVGNGVIYTVQTPSNVIDTYNQTTVYGLKNFDDIYSHTDPNALKVTTGDSLEMTYLESPDQSSHTVEWTDVLSVSLMVERTTSDLSVLEKY